MLISWMLITLSFKKSLIVEEFQGNYLNSVTSFSRLLFYRSDTFITLAWQLAPASLLDVFRLIGHQRVKLPILKWSKDGATTISLPNIQHVVGADFVLLCGDIHPHPGPRSTLKPSVNGTTTLANKCSSTQDSRNRNHYILRWLF